MARSRTAIAANNFRAIFGDASTKRTNSERAKTITPMSLSAITEAVLGAWSRREISPKRSPGPRVATFLPPTRQRALPETIKKASSAVRALLGQDRPAVTSTSRTQRRNGPQLLLGEPREQRLSGQHLENVGGYSHGAPLVFAEAAQTFRTWMQGTFSQCGHTNPRGVWATRTRLQYNRRTPRPCRLTRNVESSLCTGRALRNIRPVVSEPRFTGLGVSGRSR